MTRAATFAVLGYASDASSLFMLGTSTTAKQVLSAAAEAAISSASLASAEYILGGWETTSHYNEMEVPNSRKSKKLYQVTVGTGLHEGPEAPNCRCQVIKESYTILSSG